MQAGSFVTADDIAEALLEYAATLADAQRAATVHVPAVGIDPPGVTVLVGPASQLMAEPVDESGTPPADDGFVNSVGERIAKLTQSFGSSNDPSAVEWDI